MQTVAVWNQRRCVFKPNLRQMGLVKMSVLTAFKNFDELKSKAMEGVVFFFPVKYCVCDASMLMFGYIQYRKKVNGKTTRTYFAADCLQLTGFSF